MYEDVVPGSILFSDHGITVLGGPNAAAQVPRGRREEEDVGGRERHHDHEEVHGPGGGRAQEAALLADRRPDDAGRQVGQVVHEDGDGDDDERARPRVERVPLVARVTEAPAAGAGGGRRPARGAHAPESQPDVQTHGVQPEDSGQVEELDEEADRRA